MSEDQLAAAIPGKLGKELTVYDNYFKAERSGYELTHEMGHNTLNLSDKLPASTPLVKGHIIATGKGFNYSYRWPGVAAANAAGKKITDSFTCSVGFEEC